MGRMADARKKAQQKKAGGSPADPPPPPAAEGPEPEPLAEAIPEAEPEPRPRMPPPELSFSDDPPATVPFDERRPGSAEGMRWVSREETLTFPAEPVSRAPEPVREEPPPPPPPSGHRIALPSSGLASDILAREDSLQMESMLAASAELPAPSEPVAPVVPFQNVSFFGPQSRDERKVTAEAMEHLVTFFLADEEYGLDVRVVQEIIRVTEITHVPRAPEFIKGVINLRGRIIPVVDLKRKLELGEVTPSRLSRIVVVKLRDRLVGLLVDGASQVLKIPVSNVDAAPEEILDVNVSFIRGVAKLQNRLIILLDLQKILAVEIEHAAAQ